MGKIYLKKKKTKYWGKCLGCYWDSDPGCFSVKRYPSKGYGCGGKDNIIIIQVPKPKEADNG